MMLSIFLVIAFALEAVHPCSNNGNLKYVGERCKDDSECYNGGSTDAVSCKAGICECNDGYKSQLQWFTPKEQRLVCLPAPYQDQPCTTTCQKPFFCVDSKVPGIKTCQCRFPFIMKDGYCFKECKADEVFEFGDCMRRCEDGENRAERAICKKMGKLGDPCDTKNECYAPFSQCVKGICSCPSGFEPNEKKDACQSSHRTCPIGEPIRTKDHKIVECKIVRKRESSNVLASILPFPFPRPRTPDQLEDNCADGQFCMLTSGESYYAEGAIGHCCPKPKFSCPIGHPHPNATCGQSVPWRIAPGEPNPSAPYCPYGSYSCVRFVLGGGFEMSLCCPAACGTNQVFVDGTCYPKRNHADRCQVNEQCKQHNGVCEKGRCVCGNGYVAEGTIGYKYCRRVCKENEVVSNDRCYPKLKLGDKCDPNVYGQCPSLSYCSDQKICDCFCGYVKLSDDACGPQPTCPAIEASKKPSFMDIVKITALTLCRIPRSPRSSASSVVDTCPKGQYCASYVSEYGLCCPKPEKPFCANGATPAGKCDPKDPDPCGPLSFCSRYMNPAGDDSNSDYVCCPVAPAVELPLLFFNKTEELP